MMSHIIASSQPPAERIAADGRDRRLAAGGDTVAANGREIAGEHVDEGLWLHFLDVGAGRKGLFAAGDQDASMASSASRSSTAAAISRNTPNDNAFSIFGRFSVMMPTAPLLSTMMFSNVAMVHPGA